MAKIHPIGVDWTQNAETNQWLWGGKNVVDHPFEIQTKIYFN